MQELIKNLNTYKISQIQQVHKCIKWQVQIPKIMKQEQNLSTNTNI
jgi:hypothetical protein